MSKIKRYAVETAEREFADLDLFKDGNNYITETAGFVPLEVKLKRFEEAGIQMQFQSGEFTSTDYRNMYLNPDFEITPEDDFEEIQEKLKIREEYISKLKAAKSNGGNEPPTAAKAGTEEPEKKAAEAADGEKLPTQ